MEKTIILERPVQNWMDDNDEETLQAIAVKGNSDHDGMVILSHFDQIGES